MCFITYYSKVNICFHKYRLHIVPVWNYLEILLVLPEGIHIYSCHILLRGGADYQTQASLQGDRGLTESNIGSPLSKTKPRTSSSQGRPGTLPNRLTEDGQEGPPANQAIRPSHSPTACLTIMMWYWPSSSTQPPGPQSLPHRLRSLFPNSLSSNLLLCHTNTTPHSCIALRSHVGASPPIKSPHGEERFKK